MVDVWNETTLNAAEYGNSVKEQNYRAERKNKEIFFTLLEEPAG
jgi:hypothetical protein